MALSQAERSKRSYRRHIIARREYQRQYARAKSGKSQASVEARENGKTAVLKDASWEYSRSYESLPAADPRGAMEVNARIKPPPIPTKLQDYVQLRDVIMPSEEEPPRQGALAMDDTSHIVRLERDR